VLPKKILRLLAEFYSHPAVMVKRKIYRAYKKIQPSEHRKKIDIAGILQSIHDYSWVILKYNVPYMPADFPVHYPVGKDIDILCSQSEFHTIVTCLLTRIKKEYKKDYNILRIKISDHRVLLRMETEKGLVLEFDVSSKIFDKIVCDCFNEDLIAYSIPHEIGVRVPSPEFEYIVRMLEVSRYPEKKHHIEYLKSHRADFSNALCKKYLGSDFSLKLMQHI